MDFTPPSVSMKLKECVVVFYEEEKQILEAITTNRFMLQLSSMTSS